MATFFIDGNRDVIPRWRDFGTTMALGELGDSVAEKPTIEPSPSEIDNKIETWKYAPNLGVAADLINTVGVSATNPYVAEAIEFLLKHEHLVSEPLRQIAKGLTREGEKPRASFIDAIDPFPESTRLSKLVHFLRVRINEQPRNSILYVEKARAYVLLGQNEKAKKSMLTAVRISPNNRFVLRSASRLFIHLHEFRLAHDILRYAERTKFDPWLLAAEISVASAVKHSARYLKEGVRLLKSSTHPPFSLTELAAALGMEELEHGKNRVARKYLETAVICPTENSLAQIEWARRQKLISGIQSFHTSNVPFAYELLAWESHADRNWSAVTEQALLWHRDQPFSSRPLYLASYTASTMQCDYQTSIDILERGENILNKDISGQFTFLNNLAFAYASNNQPDLAAGVLSRINRNQLTQENLVYFTGTEGLIEFRNGNLEAGRQLYTNAVGSAIDQNNKDLAVRAFIYYVREELRINSNMHELRESVFRLAGESKNEELTLIAENQIGREHKFETSKDTYLPRGFEITSVNLDAVKKLVG
jgi:tetratricopeptide (TPR) repeat protein